MPCARGQNGVKRQMLNIIVRLKQGNGGVEADVGASGKGISVKLGCPDF